MFCRGFNRIKDLQAKNSVAGNAEGNLSTQTTQSHHTLSPNGVPFPDGVVPPPPAPFQPNQGDFREALKTLTDELLLHLNVTVAELDRNFSKRF